MRLDAEHAEKLRASIIRDANGDPVVSFDIDFMMSAFNRLTLWERGILTDALLRSAAAKRPTIEQRALLAMFLPPVEKGGAADE